MNNQVAERLNGIDLLEIRSETNGHADRRHVRDIRGEAVDQTRMPIPSTDAIDLKTKQSQSNASPSHRSELREQRKHLNRLGRWGDHQIEMLLVHHIAANQCVHPSSDVGWGGNECTGSPGHGPGKPVVLGHKREAGTWYAR